jgi:PAS domain S-box-containing protein
MDIAPAHHNEGKLEAKPVVIGAAVVGCGVALVEGFLAAGMPPLSPLGWPGIFLIIAGAFWGAAGAIGGALMLVGYFLFTLGAPQRFPHFFANAGVLSFWFIGLGLATTVAATLRGRLMRAHALELKAAQNESEISALIDYRHWLSSIIDNAPALIGYIDAEQRFRFNNATYEHWLEKPKGQITGRTVREVFGEAEYQRLKPELERALRGGRVTFHHELRLHGEVRHAQTTYVPDYDPGGKVRGCFVVAKDIGSTVKELRATLERAEPALDDSSPGVATASLLTERLRRALARARRSGSPLALLQLGITATEPLDEARAGEIAARLRAAVRLTDTVARMDGDKFVVLLEGLKERGDAFRVAEKILQETRLPTSIGVAFPEDDALTPEALLERAAATASRPAACFQSTEPARAGSSSLRTRGSPADRR